MVPLPSYFGTCSLSFKYPEHASPLIIESVSYFSISIWYGDNFNEDEIGIKYNNFNRTVTYQFQNEELNSVITPSMFLQITVT